ncbi:MAG TPA: hypothetical protein VI978_01765 [Candidatus Paceibacterota bacterium]
MDISFLSYKPVLIGMHLGFAIVGIDAFLWYLGELATKSRSEKRKGLKLAAIAGIIGFALSWLAGGYYYVVYYGKLVKPVIKAGTAPWAHAVAMEAKEHIFLFILPLAVTALILALLDKKEFENHNLRRISMLLAGVIVFLSLAIGGMGFIISAAARWG